ncbi:hypothetical protein ACFC00_31400 [Streptomyces adustus]|uniref:hypothetical protein n=1 Tax=Streptomyces adustus TaxID=1609272 RepID=UPI0035D6746C
MVSGVGPDLPVATVVAPLDPVSAQGRKLLDQLRVGTVVSAPRLALGQMFGMPRGRP